MDETKRFAVRASIGLMLDRFSQFGGTAQDMIFEGLTDMILNTEPNAMLPTLNDYLTVDFGDDEIGARSFSNILKGEPVKDEPAKVVEVSSDRDWTVKYKVSVNAQGVPIECTCKDWVIRHNDNPLHQCKHMKRVANDYGK